MLILSALGFALIALLVTRGATTGFDRWLVGALRADGAPHDPLGPGLLTAFAGDFTNAGGRAILSVFGLLAAGFLATLRDWRRLAFLVFSLLGGAGLADVFKRLFERARPDIVPHLAHETSLSFPSGHATYSALAYITACILLIRVVPTGPARVWLLFGTALVVLLIGISRVWLGVHYPTDVLAGWCLGTAWACACWLGVGSPGRR